MTSGTHKEWFRLTAILCAVLLVPGDLPAQQAAPDSKAAATGQPNPAAAEKPPKTADQLDTLVAPIALYPDPLLAQVLAASTYPLEIVQAQRWLQTNTALKGEALTKGAQKQPWDPSVQAMVAFPSALKLLDGNLQWTTELGDAVLDQQSDVMDAVQRMRKKAKDGGKLESSKEQRIEVKTVETKTIIEIQPSDPQVIYVPSYSPTVVYPPPVYAYPPYYPVYPTAGAVAATAAISFGVGVAMGAFWSGGGGYGWGCGWGGNNNITINNNFSQRNGYNNIQGGNRTNIGGGDRTNVGGGRGNSGWQHNPEHRKSVPYGSQRSAKQFGGSARDAGGGTQRFDRGGQGRTSSQVDRGSPNRGGQAGTRDVGGGRGGSQAGARGGGGQDRVGDRSVQNRGGGERSAFGGADSRSRTQAASNRGASSARSSSSFSGGGGGRGGGGRGGGRRR